MKKYNLLNDFIVDKYFSLSYLLEDTISRWDNFVCNFFGWNSYYLPSFYNPLPKRDKPIKEILGEKITRLFDIRFDKKGMTLIRKLEPAFT